MRNDKEKRNESSISKVCSVCRGRGEIMSLEHSGGTRCLDALYEVCYACGGTGLTLDDAWEPHKSDRMRQNMGRSMNEVSEK